MSIGSRWFDNRCGEIVEKWLNKSNRQTVIELGTFHGETAKSISLRFPNVLIISVDSFQIGKNTDAGNKEIYLKNQTNNMVLIEKTTKEAYSELQQIKADIIIIDADHSYEETLWNLDNYKSLLMSNGVLICHDMYFLKEVTNAVNDFIKYNTQWELKESIHMLAVIGRK